MASRLSFGAFIALFSLALGLSLYRAPILSGAPMIEEMETAEAASVMFDRADYALARSWRASKDGDSEAARRWARESVARSPGNAYAALALAWGETLAGDERAGRDALERSYRLAPRSTPLAVSRVSLAQRWWPEMSDDERERLLVEVRIARGFDAAAFNRLAEETPRLRALFDLAETEPR